MQLLGDEEESDLFRSEPHLAGHPPLPLPLEAVLRPAVLAGEVDERRDPPDWMIRHKGRAERLAN